MTADQARIESYKSTSAQERYGQIKRDIIMMASHGQCRLICDFPGHEVLQMLYSDKYIVADMAVGDPLKCIISW